jgi:AraC-like DNA-binding protein
VSFIRSGSLQSIRFPLDVLSSGLVHATQRRRDSGRVASAAAFDLLRETAGRLTIERIASLTGVSLRQLRRVARRESGMPLKAYARVVRLIRTIAATDGVPDGTPIEWAWVAIDAGYCDQPHLIRDCRAISGLSPTELARERRGELDPDVGPGSDFTPRAAWAISTGSHTPPGPGIRHAHRSLRDGADAVSLRE